MGAPHPEVRLERIAALDQPLAMAVRTHDDALYVAEKTGRVVSLIGNQTRPVLDLSAEVSLGAEQGLLGLSFSPDGRFLYVDYTDRHGDTHVTSFAMEDRRADPSTRRDLLFVRQPFSNHNGGEVVFGPDGALYVGLGDGGSGGDPFGNGQSLSTLLGKILRVRPTPEANDPYAIPSDNPFVGRDEARPEIWAYGLRNPWRFSFDRQTGDLWIGDVGQSAWEEVDRQPAGSKGGENYGWNVMEGDHPYAGGSTAGMIRPVYEYPHVNARCSITGGYVYRGSAIPDLFGWYVFADFCVGRLEAIRLHDGDVQHVFLGPTLSNLSSFGEDGGGELYALSLSGEVDRLVP
jgi:glucose/arabinose dehydrogenase